jgi:hypothetical protein
MNVDPRIIADMMTEDPDQFNILNEDSFVRLYDLGRSLDYELREKGVGTPVYMLAIQKYMNSHQTEIDELAGRITNINDLKKFIDSAATKGKIPSLIEIQKRLAEREAYNRGQGQATQAQQPQAQPGNFTKRSAFMIRLVVLANPGAEIPETAEGYNQLGRTAGFLKYTTQNSSWSTLISNNQFQEMLKDVRQELREQIVTELARYVSRA